LKQLLSSYGLKQEEMKTIVDKRRENLHQVACLRLFEAVHPGAVSDNVGNHPNAFFNSSFDYLKAIEKKNKKAGGQPTTDVSGTPAAVVADQHPSGGDVEMS